jgi:hypothetical protein
MNHACIEASVFLAAPNAIALGSTCFSWLQANGKWQSADAAKNEVSARWLPFKQASPRLDASAGERIDPF